MHADAAGREGRGRRPRPRRAGASRRASAPSSARRAAPAATAAACPAASASAPASRTAARCRWCASSPSTRRRRSAQKLEGWVQVRSRSRPPARSKDATVVKSSNSVFESAAVQAVTSGSTSRRCRRESPPKSPNQQVVVRFQMEGMMVLSNRTRSNLAAARRSHSSSCVALGSVAVHADARRRRRSSEAKKLGISRIGRREAARAAYELLEGERFDDALAIVDELAKRRRLQPARARADPPLPRLHLRQQGPERGGRGGVREVARPARARSGGRAGDDLLARADLHAARQVRPGARADRPWFEAAESPKPDAYFLKAMILVQQEKFKDAAEPARRPSSSPTSRSESWLSCWRDLHPAAGLPERSERPSSGWSRSRPRKTAVLGAARRGAAPPGARGEGARDAAARLRGRTC